jgi:hypothetical protein
MPPNETRFSTRAEKRSYFEGSLFPLEFLGRAFCVGKLAYDGQAECMIRMKQAGSMEKGTSVVIL